MGGEGHCPPPTTEQQQHLDDLAKLCADFAQLGKIVPYYTNPLQRLLHENITNGAGASIKHERDNITIRLDCFLTLDRIGFKKVTVEENARVVFKALSVGLIMKNVSAEIYTPGEWEKKIIA